MSPEPGATTPPTQPKKSRAGRNLPAAISVGVGLVVIIVGTLMWWHWGFAILVAIALVLACRELHHALSLNGMQSASIPVCVGTVVIALAPYVLREFRLRGIDLGIVNAGVVLGAIGMTVVAALIWRMPKGPQGFVRDVAASLFTIAYVPLLGSFVTLMLAGEQGGARVVCFILTVAASDTGGYIAGVLFGRHQMSPVISPKKTWEGLAGSYVLACVVAVCFAVFVFHAPWWAGLILGVALTSVGVAGDLVESLVKRDVEIKDMSSFLPGHGGVMDRLDSLLLAAPFAWLILFLMVPGG